MKVLHGRKTAGQVVLAAAIMAFAVSVYAQEVSQGPGSRGKGTMDGERRHGFVEKMLEDLGLTPEQKTALFENKKQHREEMKAVQEQIRIEREAIRAEFAKADTDRESVNSHAAKLKELQSRKVDLHIEGMIAAKEILTPEQFTKFMGKMKEKRGERGKGKWSKRWMMRGKHCERTAVVQD